VEFLWSFVEFGQKWPANTGTFLPVSVFGVPNTGIPVSVYSGLEIIDMMYFSIFFHISSNSHMSEANSKHFWVNNSLKIKVHTAAVLTSNFPLYFRVLVYFRGKTSIPANTGIDIFEIPVLYRPRY
jgi:hypothetical protein